MKSFIIVPDLCGFISECSSQIRTSVDISFANVVNVIFNKRDISDKSDDENTSYTDKKNSIPNTVQYGGSSGSFGNTVHYTSSNDDGIQSTVS